MKTVGERYDPIINCAKENDINGHKLLEEEAKLNLKTSDECKTIEQARDIARANLDYYCQYCDKETTLKVKEFYELGSSLRNLHGKTNILI